MAITVTGKVIDISHNVDIPYAQKDGTYQGSTFVYKDSGGEIRTKNFTTKTLEMNTSLAEGLAGLSKDDDFTMTLEKNSAGYTNVTSLTKGLTATPTTSKGGGRSGFKKSDDFVIGQIKGNVASNAVALAIKNAKGAAVTQEDLIAAAKMVIALHADLEATDLKSLLKSGTTVSGEKTTETESVPF